MSDDHAYSKTYTQKEDAILLFVGDFIVSPKNTTHQVWG